jgi:hypothetical protein
MPVSPNIVMFEVLVCIGVCGAVLLALFWRK